MNALYLKDLAIKTHRGLEGRVRNGKSGGGKAYGYRPVRRTTTDGTLMRGDLEIVEEQAIIVRRILSEFRAGLSPRAIARSLNAERIPGPEAERGGIRRSAAMPRAAPASCAISFMSAG